MEEAKAEALAFCFHLKGPFFVIPGFRISRLLHPVSFPFIHFQKLS